MIDEVIQALSKALPGWAVSEDAADGTGLCVGVSLMAALSNRRVGERRCDEWVLSFTLFENREAARCVMLYKLRRALEGLGFFGFEFDNGSLSRCVQARIRRWRP